MEENQEKIVGPIDGNGLSDLLAWDTVRSYGNQIQVFLNPDHALLVLREIVGVTTGGPDGEAGIATKNVASWIMPLDVANQLGVALSQLDFEAVKNAKPSD